MPVRVGGFATESRETAAAGRHPTGMQHLTKSQLVLSWILQLTVAGILLQTLFFKFTGAEESVYIFTAVHAEPWGRIGSGVVELIAALLLLVPATVSLGAILTMGVLAGALLTHLTILGLVVMDDGGVLFALALVGFIGSAIVLVLRRADIPVLGRYFELAS
jgi:hypothetical protein